MICGKAIKIVIQRQSMLLLIKFLDWSI